jgi:hypothetical protein
MSDLKYNLPLKSKLNGKYSGVLSLIFNSIVFLNFMAFSYIEIFFEIFEITFVFFSLISFLVSSIKEL